MTPVAAAGSVAVGMGIAGLATAEALRRRSVTNFETLEQEASGGGVWRDIRLPRMAAPAKCSCARKERR